MSLHVVHVTAPSAFGGLERVLMGLCPGLVREGLRVTLVAVLEPEAHDPPFLARVEESGVDVVRLRLPARAYTEERRQVSSLLRERQADIIHTHGYRSDVVDGPCGRAVGVPVVSTLHGFTRQGWKGRAYEWLQLRVLRRGDALVAVSDPLAEELVRRGVPKDRVVVIRNGIVGGEENLMSQAVARARLGVEGVGAVVGWVGRFSVEKDPLLAVRAFAGAHLPDDAVLCMVGDGPLREPCVEEARRLDVGDRVVFPGSVPDAASLFKAFDLLLLSSSTEGTPMAILEAAVAGVPVVSTAVGGVPALLGPGSPALVPHGEPGRLGEAVGTVLLDADAAARALSGLQARVLTDDPGGWIRQYAELYQGLAAARGGTAGREARL